MFRNESQTAAADEERREHKERAAEYEDAWASHQERVREWRVQTGQEQPKNLGAPLQEQIVRRIRREIERKFGPGDGVPTEELCWRLLPPGESSEERVRRYYVGLQNKNRGTRYDPDRIVKALSLNPKQRYEEIGRVEGYTVFTLRYPQGLGALVEDVEAGAHGRRIGRGRQNPT